MNSIADEISAYLAEGGRAQAGLDEAQQGTNTTERIARYLRGGENTATANDREEWRQGGATPGGEEGKTAWRMARLLVGRAGRTTGA